MEDKKPKDRPDRHFHFEKEATYIENQEITVQSGANFYNGPAPKKLDEEEEKPEPEKVEQAEAKVELPKEEKDPKLAKLERLANCSTPDEWIKVGIKAVVDENLIEYGYDWAAVFRIIKEATTCENMTPNELVKVVDGMKLNLTGETKCIANNFRNIEIKGTYPKWSVKSWDVSVRFSRIARTFLQAYLNAQT